MTDDRIKFRHLQCFLAVAQNGSLQKAAHSLSITQPAVSKTLKELEALLGVRLFERGRKGAVPTPEGRVFAHHAGASVSALRDAVASVTPARQLGMEVVTVGVLPTVAPWLMPALLRQLDEAGSRISLRIHTASNPTLLLQLRQRELDLVIGRFAEPTYMLGLTFEHLYTDPLVLVVRPGHPLLKVAELKADPLTHLNHFTVILPTQDTAIRHTADNFLSACGATLLSRIIETLSVSLARNYTRSSDAVWLSPRGAVTQELTEGALVALDMGMTGTRELIGLSVRAGVQASVAQASVINAIRIAARTLPDAAGIYSNG